LFVVGYLVTVIRIIMFIVVIVQFCSKTLMLGGYLLLICLLAFIILRMMKMVWYGLLFFLVYIGGLLVLFLYVFSLKSKPQVRLFKYLKRYFVLLGGFFFFFFFLTVKIEDLDIFLGSFVEEKSYSLFNLNESVFVVFIGLFLVYVLLVISYLSCKKNSALRPMSV